MKHLCSDHGKEFENSKFDDFCSIEGLDHKFSTPRIPQQNGMVERKNRTLKDMARTMLIASNLPKNFLAKAEPCYENDFEIGLTRTEESANFDEELTPAGTDKKHISKNEMNVPDSIPQEEQADEGTQVEEQPEVEATEEPQVEGTGTMSFESRPWKSQKSHSKKLDEYGTVTRNKARLVAKGYNQHEDVYVEQPPGFENPELPNQVYKLDKALYGLKQAPKSWYERLSKFLLSHDFIRDKVDRTLFLRSNGTDILVIQIYVNDIIFGATNDLLYKEFANPMSSEFEMSMMGELNFFLGLQIKQT
ncbi:uncharacterized protein LOC125493976 [Beta vulgaris subsp. vulgaris]|uniref:uncharacterized protein LOC125493976 n=1 Tax=Beta vulgaris subsp. vulgaris TaxID=3555 RepID=UPI0020375092|nr:uncharacterized protein LOC125493976 [Beta vulgaris subsp. vulgaris]